MTRPSPRHKITPDHLEHLAALTPFATVEFQGDIAHLHGFPVPFWAELEPAGVAA